MFGNEKFIGYPGETCVWERVGVEPANNGEKRWGNGDRENSLVFREGWL